MDVGNNRIQKFDNNGNFISMWGSKGSGAGQFDRPWGVAFDSSGNVYVTDQRNNRIQKFDGNGKYISEWGEEGHGPGQVVHLHAIAINGDIIYVSDAMQERTEEYQSTTLAETIFPCGAALKKVMGNLTSITGSISKCDEMVLILI
jgi:DNA-binding beta-propeller fold protein YncE